MIGLYVSYATPIFLRITSGRDKLVPGPFTLGKWYLPIGIVAVAWVSFICVLLMFPPEQTVTAPEMSQFISYFLLFKILIQPTKYRLRGGYYHGRVYFRGLVLVDLSSQMVHRPCEDSGGWE